MFPSNSTYIGIDPTAGQRPFVYAALDDELHLLALGQGSMEDVLAFAAGQRQATVAVSAPPRPNQGVMARPEIRQELLPAPAPGRWMDFRLAEYMLRQHNLSIPRTGRQEDECPNWLKQGFTLHRRLESLGYQPYPHEGAARQSMEVYPYACYAVLLGILPFPKGSLEGRLQRQLVLYDQKVRVPDPMIFFEEVTAHRLRHGILPTDQLYSPYELDALVAAFTAWLVATHPERTLCVGDPQEGQIVLPVATLNPHYPTCLPTKSN